MLDDGHLYHELAHIQCGIGHRLIQSQILKAVRIDRRKSIAVRQIQSPPVALLIDALQKRRGRIRLTPIVGKGLLRFIPLPRQNQRDGKLRVRIAADGVSEICKVAEYLAVMRVARHGLLKGGGIHGVKDDYQEILIIGIVEHILIRRDECAAFIRKLGGKKDRAECDGKNKGDGKAGIGAELHEAAAAKLLHKHQCRRNDDEPQGYGADTVNRKAAPIHGLTVHGRQIPHKEAALHPAADKRDKAGRTHNVIQLLAYPAGNIQHQKRSEKGGGKQPQRVREHLPCREPELKLICHIQLIRGIDKKRKAQRKGDKRP